MGYSFRLIQLLLLYPLIVCLFIGCNKYMELCCVCMCACVCELEGCLRLKSFDNCGRNGMPIVTFSLFFIIFFVQTNEAYINVCECTWNYLFIVCIAPCNHTEDNTQLTTTNELLRKSSHAFQKIVFFSSSVFLKIF